MNNKERKYAFQSFSNILSDVLTKYGFSKSKNIWKKELDETIIICELEYETISDDVSVLFAIWLKELEDVSLSDLSYDPWSAHISCNLNAFLEGLSFYQLITACHVVPYDFNWHLSHYSAIDPQNISIINSAFSKNRPESLEEKLCLFSDICSKKIPLVIETFASEGSIENALFNESLYVTAWVVALKYLRSEFDRGFEGVAYEREK